MRRGALFAGLCLSFLLNQRAVLEAADAPVDLRVQELLSKMTLEEKVGQMTQVTLEVVAAQAKKEGDPWLSLDAEKLRGAVIDHHVGSILNCAGQARTGKNWQSIIREIQELATRETRLGIPVIYGIDSIHGATYVTGATLFPQSIAMAATGNRDLAYQEGLVTARETRAAGIPWNFNPVLGLAREPRWSRFWETYGEDPFLAGALGARYIEGLEGSDLASDEHVAACMKHYLGYSVPHSGKDRTPAYIPERQLREIFLPPFAAAARAGVATVMVNSSEINGIPVHSSHAILTDLLRGELGFDGFVVSDWADVKNLFEREHVAADYREAVKLSVLAGMDMAMVPYDFAFYDLLVDLVRDGEVPVARIDEAVADILRVKFRLGLFDAPFPSSRTLTRIGTAAARKVNARAAREALTLLRNDANSLPLSREQRIFLTGPCADKLSVLNGGWTITWQGDREDLYPKDARTVREALAAALPKGHLLYQPGVSFTEDAGSARAVQQAAAADVIVACMGEPTYCETPGNIDDLTLSAVQLAYLDQLIATGKPVVLVLIEGRPRVVSAVADRVAAVLMAYLPGMEGGPAIADVLLGEVNPSGKLPFTYPRFAGWHTTYDHKYSEEQGGNAFQPQWPFGHGLSYTTFAYGGLTLSKTRLSRRDKLKVSVTVTNTGARAGQETVQLFVSDLVASVTPAVRRLRGFEKVSLKPGESRTVGFDLTTDDLAFIGRDLQPVVEPGEFAIHVGGLSATCWLR